MFQYPLMISSFFLFFFLYFKRWFNSTARGGRGGGVGGVGDFKIKEINKEMFPTVARRRRRRRRRRRGGGRRKSISFGVSSGMLCCCCCCCCWYENRIIEVDNCFLVRLVGRQGGAADERCGRARDPFSFRQWRRSQLRIIHRFFHFFRLIVVRLIKLYKVQFSQ